MEIKLNVNGMVCDGCEKRVENILKTVDGITNVKASFKEKTVVIEANKDLDIEKIKEKIADIGFIVI